MDGAPILRSCCVALPTRLRCTGSRASFTIEYELRGQNDWGHVRKFKSPSGTYDKLLTCGYDIRQNHHSTFLQLRTRGSSRVQITER